MAIPVEVTIILKDSEKTLKSKHLVYEEISMASDDPEIDRLVQEARKSFTGEPSDVQVKASMTL